MHKTVLHLQLRFKIITNANDFTVICLQDSKVNIPCNSDDFGSSVIDIKKPEWTGDKKVTLYRYIALKSTKTLRSPEYNNFKSRLPCEENYSDDGFRNLNECVESHFEDENSCSLPWKDEYNKCTEALFVDYFERVFERPTFSAVYNKTGCVQPCEQMVSKSKK